MRAKGTKDDRHIKEIIMISGVLSFYKLNYRSIPINSEVKWGLV